MKYILALSIAFVSQNSFADGGDRSCTQENPEPGIHSRYLSILDLNTNTIVGQGDGTWPGAVRVIETDSMRHNILFAGLLTGSQPNYPEIDYQSKDGTTNLVVKLFDNEYEKAVVILNGKTMTFVCK